MQVFFLPHNIGLTTGNPTAPHPVLCVVVWARPETCERAISSSLYGGKLKTARKWKLCAEKKSNLNLVKSVVDVYSSSSRGSAFSVAGYGRGRSTTACVSCKLLPRRVIRPLIFLLAELQNPQRQCHAMPRSDCFSQLPTQLHARVHPRLSWPLQTPPLAEKVGYLDSDRVVSGRSLKFRRGVLSIRSRCM